MMAADVASVVVIVKVFAAVEPIVRIPVLEFVISPPAAVVKFPVTVTLVTFEVVKLVTLRDELSIVSAPVALFTVNDPLPKVDGRNADVELMVVVPLNTTLLFVPVVGTKLIVPLVIVIVAPLPRTTFAGAADVMEPAVSTRAPAEVPKLNFAVPVDPKSTTPLAWFSTKPFVRVTVVLTPTAVPTKVNVRAAANVIGFASVGITPES